MRTRIHRALAHLRVRLGNLRAWFPAFAGKLGTRAAAVDVAPLASRSARTASTPCAVSLRSMDSRKEPMLCSSIAPMKSLTVIGLVLVLLAAGVVMVRYGRGFRLAAPPPSMGPAPEEGQGLGDVGPVVQLEPFVVSELEGNGQRVSTVTFEVEVNDTAGRDLVRSRTSEVRSAILALLADTRLTEIGDPGDLAYLKKKVQGRVESVLPEHVVRRLLITEFLSF